MCTYVYICIFVYVFMEVYTYIYITHVHLFMHLSYSMHIHTLTRTLTRCGCKSIFLMVRSMCAPVWMAVWRTDVALLPPLAQTRNCRCIGQQRSKPGQRWWKRCCYPTLTLCAMMLWCVVEVVYGGVRLDWAFLFHACPFVCVQFKIVRSFMYTFIHKYMYCCRYASLLICHIYKTIDAPIHSFTSFRCNML